MVQWPQADDPFSRVSRHTTCEGRDKPQTGPNPYGKGDYLRERTQSTSPKPHKSDNHESQQLRVFETKENDQFRPNMGPVTDVRFPGTPPPSF